MPNLKKFPSRGRCKEQDGGAEPYIRHRRSLSVAASLFPWGSGPLSPKTRACFAICWWEAGRGGAAGQRAARRWMLGGSNLLGLLSSPPLPNVEVSGIRHGWSGQGGRGLDFSGVRGL